MLIAMVPLVVLYELSIVLAAALRPPAARSRFAAEPAPEGPG